MNFGPMVAFYERVVDPLTLPIGLAAIKLCNLAAGDRVIDVAAGTGALAAEAARSGLRALATDIEPNMVARAAERLAAFSDCEARTMSFDALDVPDASFDAALSVVGVLAFANGQAGLRELVRVTRNGGRVAVGAWDQERAEAPQYLAYNVFDKLFPGRQLWPAEFFPSWSKAAVVAALREAGCVRAEVHEVEGAWRVQTPIKVMEESGASIRMFPGYKALDENERSRFDGAFISEVSRHKTSDGEARMATRAFVVIGHVPG
jgi:ubiquinone/menaquinone biosynthesis C-methylase UbiE